MILVRSKILLLATFVSVLVAVSPTASATGDDWKPVDASDVALKTPLVEKDADSEAIFWEVRVDDGDAGDLVFSNYVRVKIFTERGKEDQSRIDLPYIGRYKIKDIAARTIKPDGSIVELKSTDIFERTIVKTNGIKVKAKSFAMPAVEVGSIIEYRWREVRSESSANYVDLQFQRDIPARTITYLVRPYTGPYANGLAYQPFQMPGQVKFEKAKDGFYRLSLNNVPAYHEEPRMPPEDSVRSWVLLYYSDNTSRTPDKFWTELGKRLNDVTKEDMKVNDEVRRVATEVVGDAAAPEEKLRRLYEYCQTKIKNVDRPSSGLTPDERDKLKENKSPSDTLKRGMGTGGNIDSLFAALATAAGFEAHLALSGNRQYIFLDRNFADPYFLISKGSSFIAVRLGETFRFFSPAETYTPFGMLGWREEGQSALVLQKDPVWAETPISEPDKSLKKRVGTFRLTEDGTLEGEVKIEFSGQVGMDEKYNNEDDSPTEREKNLTDEVKARLSTAELTNIKIENVADSLKSFAVSYHIRVPGYSQRTGKRIFLQPGFFTRGIGPLFAASDRRNSIYFRYPWSEEDHITIELPQGYALDNADAPPLIPATATQNICEFKIGMQLNNGTRTLIYDRKFFFGGHGSILFSPKTYPSLKQLFDMVNKGDGHTITLKQDGTTASN